MILSTIFTGILGVVLLCFLYVRKKFSFWSDRNVLYVEPEFPFGNIKGVGTKIHMAFITKKIYDLFTGKDVLAGLYFFVRPAIVVLDPELIKNILVKDFQYFHDRGVYHNEKDDPLSGHLFSLEGTKWKNLRAKLTPTFTSGKMKMMFSTVLSVAEEFKNHVKTHADAGDTIEIKDILSRFTTDVIGTCAFGIDCNSLKDPNAEFRVMGRKTFEPPKLRQGLMMFVSSFPNLSKKLGLKITDSEVSDFFLRIVKETVEYRENNNIDRKDFMQLLLKLKNTENSDENLTMNEIAAQSFIFFLAGFETSSTTMTFCLYELAKNPDVQQKSRDEINKVLAKHDGKITYEAMLELPYLDMVINETLRKYPAVDNLIRTAGKDYPVEGTNHTIDKGLFVMIPVYALHHDPNIYPDPEKFDPERFNKDNVESRHPYTFLPFGEGPRVCIGMRFGMMQTRVGLVSIIMNYKLTPTEKTQKVIEFIPSAPIITAKGGVWLKVENL